MRLRKKRLLQVSLDGGDTSQEQPVTREYRDDDRRLTGTMDRINLSEAIAHLPAGYRTALVLFDLEGYGHGEIARMMDWSVGNSKSQLHKARRKLRDWLRLHGGKAFSVSRAKANPNYEAEKSSGEQTHYSVSRAVGILGLGSRSIFKVTTDETYRHG